MKIHYNIWFDNEERAFDETCFKILEAVEETGSLNKAAMELHMTYCLAVNIMKKSEEELGFALLERKTGGHGGGGSSLTPRAKIFMARYRAFTEEVVEGVRRIQKKHFEG